MSRGPDLSPSEAVDRWLTKLRAQLSDGTVSTYYYRLKLFVEWAEDQGIKSMQEISGWDIESYELHRREQNPTTVSLNNEFGTLKNWLEYLARIEVIDEDLPDKVEAPEVPKHEQSSDTKLDQDAAAALLAEYRDNPQLFGTRNHVLLELVWHTGARANGIVALDVQDMRETDAGERYLAFVNRPETGTIRDWMYMATVPCLHSPCPHDRDPETCEYTSYQHASGCPSSRSPHHVRTGAITWMRNRGIPAEIVAERVNASVETIEQHYDKEEPIAKMIERRDPYFADLDIDTDHD